MGQNCGGVAFEKSLQFETPGKTVQTIKSFAKLNDEDILGFFSSYIEYHSLTLYLQKIQEVLDKEQSELQHFKRMRNQGNPSTNEELLIYHLDGISHQAKAIQNFYQNRRNEQEQINLKLKNEQKSWHANLTQKLHQQSQQTKPKMQMEMMSSDSQSRASQSHSIHSTQITDALTPLFYKFSNQLEKIIREGLDGDDLKKQIEQNVGQLKENIERMLKEKEELCKLLKLQNDQLNQKQLQIKELQDAAEKKMNESTELIKRDMPAWEEAAGEEAAGEEAVMAEADQSESKRKTGGFVHRILGRSKVLFSKKDSEMRERRDQILELFKRGIASTELLFEYDPVTQNHPRDYIEGKDNLLLLAKIGDGSVILGGFTPANFDDSAPNLREKNKSCFLFSMGANGNQRMVLKNETLAQFSAKIDSNFLKFGVKDLWIRCGSSRGYSYIGQCVHNIFRLENTEEEGTITSFLGISNPEFEMSCYEIHQVIFE